MADASSSMQPGGIAASRAKKLVVQSPEEIDLGGHHSCEVSDTVEIDDAGGCTKEGYVEEETKRAHSWLATGRCWLNEKMVCVDDRRSW